MKECLVISFSKKNQLNTLFLKNLYQILEQFSLFKFYLAKNIYRFRIKNFIYSNFNIRLEKMRDKKMSQDEFDDELEDLGLDDEDE